jgi:hypothetical protein
MISVSTESNTIYTYNKHFLKKWGNNLNPYLIFMVTDIAFQFCCGKINARENLAERQNSLKYLKI